jgi:hypothetical protein
VATMSYRKAFIFLFIVQVLYFNPILFRGEIIFPHSNDKEVGARAGEDGLISNRKFSDHSNSFIPEISHHLNGNHRAWISTWNPYVQLGRPTWQLSGFGKAYLITHALSLFTKNPFVFYTIFTVLTVSLTGVFLFLLLKDTGLHPLACLSAAVGLSLGPFASYWLTFPTFISTICWTLCLLWLIRRFTVKKSFALAVGISFAAYSLFMTGYPQFVLLQAYLIAGFTAVRLWRHGSAKKTKFLTGLMLAGTAFSGFVMSSTALFDIYINAQRSARLCVPDEFFLEVLPKIANIKHLGIFLIPIFDAFWPGNPIRPGYPLVFNGVSFTPLYSGLFLLSFANGMSRRLWPWHLFVALCLMGTVWPQAYLFAVKYMGFHLSRIHFLGGALIPVFILCAHAIDTILRDGTRHKLYSHVVIAALLLISISPLIILSDQYHELDIRFVLLCYFIIAGTAWFALTGKLIVMLTMVLTTVFAYGYGMMLTRPITKVHLASSLVRKIRKETRGEFRYAKVGQKLSGILPPNQEALLKIKSIHSYDSLSSLNYQRLTFELSKNGTRFFGRLFGWIDSDAKLKGEVFSYSGVSLVISEYELDEHYFLKTGEFNEIKFYHPLNKPILEAQIKSFSYGKSTLDVVVDGFLKEHDELKTERMISFDDFKRFRVTPSIHETILFLSQQYHPQWKAASGDGRPLKTVIINDFYQGAVIPPYVDEVILEFRPYVLWSWLPQLLYITFGLGFLVCRIMENKVRGKFSTLEFRTGSP